MSPQDEGQTQKKTNAHQKEEGAFEPGAHTKELLFGTRKRKRIWGGVEFSGLFSNENIAGDNYYASDISIFICNRWVMRDGRFRNRKRCPKPIRQRFATGPMRGSRKVPQVSWYI